MTEDVQFIFCVAHMRFLLYFLQSFLIIFLSKPRVGEGEHQELRLEGIPRKCDLVPRALIRRPGIEARL